MNPLSTIKSHAAYQREKGYPIPSVEDALSELEREIELGKHYERLLYKALLMFSKADCHPLYYQIIRKESVEYIEEHEFFGEYINEFRDRYEIWKRPLQ
jgi:hypothetical protein